MPTIEVSDEQYKFLKEAQSLLKTQDSRCTRDPFYCIMKKERKYGFSEEYSSDFVWCNNDTSFETTKDLFDDIMENYESDLKLCTLDYYGVEGPINNKDLESGFIDDVDNQYEMVYEDFLDKHEYYKVYYNDEHKLDVNSNIWSLFEVDAQEYIDSKYGSDSKAAYSYACSSWRSSRMNKVRDFLMEIKLT